MAYSSQSLRNPVAPGHAHNPGGTGPNQAATVGRWQAQRLNTPQWRGAARGGGQSYFTPSTGRSFATSSYSGNGSRQGYNYYPGGGSGPIVPGGLADQFAQRYKINRDIQDDFFDLSAKSGQNLSALNDSFLGAERRLNEDFGQVQKGFQMREGQLGKRLDKIQSGYADRESDLFKRLDKLDQNYLARESAARQGMDEIQERYDARGNDLDGRIAAVQKRYDDRYDTGMDLLEGFNDNRRNNINRQFDETLEGIQSGMVGSGLGNFTTNLVQAPSAIYRERQSALDDLYNTTLGHRQQTHAQLSGDAADAAKDMLRYQDDLEREALLFAQDNVNMQSDLSGDRLAFGERGIDDVMAASGDRLDFGERGAGAMADAAQDRLAFGERGAGAVYDATNHRLNFGADANDTQNALAVRRIGAMADAKNDYPGWQDYTDLAVGMAEAGYDINGNPLGGYYGGGGAGVPYGAGVGGGGGGGYGGGNVNGILGVPGLPITVGLGQYGYNVPSAAAMATNPGMNYQYMNSRHAGRSPQALATRAMQRQGVVQGREDRADARFRALGAQPENPMIQLARQAGQWMGFDIPDAPVNRDVDVMQGRGRYLGNNTYTSDIRRLNPGRIGNQLSPEEINNAKRGIATSRRLRREPAIRDQQRINSMAMSGQPRGMPTGTYNQTNPWSLRRPQAPISGGRGAARSAAMGGLRSGRQYGQVPSLQGTRYLGSGAQWPQSPTPRQMQNNAGGGVGRRAPTQQASPIQILMGQAQYGATSQIRRQAQQKLLQLRRAQMMQPPVDLSPPGARINGRPIAPAYPMN